MITFSTILRGILMSIGNLQSGTEPVKMTPQGAIFQTNQSINNFYKMTDIY